jgi:hypothetical protein
VESWELIAREQIRDTIARYNDAGDSGRYDDMAEQFTPAGVLDLRRAGDRSGARDRIEGRRALRDYFSSVAGRFTDRERRPSHVRHMVTNILIDVRSPAEAFSTAYFLVLTDAGPDHWGRYRDRLVPADGRWLFAERTVRTDGFAERSYFAGAGEPGSTDPR